MGGYYDLSHRWTSVHNPTQAQCTKMTVEGHYPDVEEITGYQKEKIAELREKAAKHLAKYPDYDTDFSLLRWLMGWDYDIDVILPKIQYTLDVLKCLRMDEITVENINEVNAKIRSMSNVTEYFPGGLMCQDDDGNVVYMQALSLTHPKTLIKSGAVTFLGSDWKEFLINELGEHNIYRHWGGSKESDLPTGDVRMGGKVPEKLQYKPEDNVDDDKKGFTKITVAARSKSEVKIHGEKGKVLRWFWRVSGGDVDFGINKDGEMVYPTFRITTEFHPEFGTLECREDGEYTFTFDNSHGKIWSKEVSYKITLQ
ncbi:hypothetical protein GCK32_008531 [Trichostrongylus colubriformis]|uniref:GOLD domain-containing protein n=1 Tax=Trichostrongylus colubriformis TaxID=6319 RepID=A0AAN8F2X8_TRICO